MSNYLKQFLFSILILIMPYTNSASKSMNTDGYDGSTIRVRNVSLTTEDTQEVKPLKKQSTFSQLKTLENSQTSLASYFIAPIKASMQMASEVVHYVVNNPKKSIVVAMSYSYVVAAAAQGAMECRCYLSWQGAKDPTTWIRMGDFGGCEPQQCNTTCSNLNFYLDKIPTQYFTIYSSDCQPFCN